MKAISDENSTSSRLQHKKPCKDCPWKRNSLKGWLGEASPEDWLHTARGEGVVKCHVVKNQQCAGIAIFRGNICKSPRNKSCLVLPADRETVFSWDDEFLAHHQEED